MANNSDKTEGNTDSIQHMSDDLMDTVYAVIDHMRIQSRAIAEWKEIAISAKRKGDLLFEALKDIRNELAAITDVADYETESQAKAFELSQTALETWDETLKHGR